MNTYFILKQAHIGFAYLTILSFSVRGVMMWLKPAWLKFKPVRILPHIIDTCLLGCAIAMLIIAQLNPLDTPWLMAKIIALLFYIVLGTIALKRGKTPKIRGVAFVLSLVCVLYIFWVAKTKLVWPFLWL